MQADKTPEELADYVREKWELGRKPIYNLIDVMEKHGVVITNVTKVFDVEAERYLECADWYVRKAIELVEGKRNCLKYL